MIETFHKGRRIGISRDGKPVGYVVAAGARWTAFVNIELPPFDVAVPGFPSSGPAVAYVAEHGHGRAEGS